MELLVGGIYTEDTFQIVQCCLRLFCSIFWWSSGSPDNKRPEREALISCLPLFLLAHSSTLPCWCCVSLLRLELGLFSLPTLNVSGSPGILPGFQHLFPGWPDWIPQFFSSYLGMFTLWNLSFILQKLIVKKLPCVSDKTWTLDIYKHRLGILTH